MGKYGEKAAELFAGGYNCSQAVFGAFAEDLGLDKATAMRIASSFGGGMGGMRDVCGTVSGMFMAAGLKYGGYGTDDINGKREHYARIQALAEVFRQKNGSIICRELLGMQAGNVPQPRTAEYYKKRPCKELCADAADILAEYMKEYPV